MTVTTRTTREMRLQALRKADAVRLGRVEFKRQVAAGERDLRVLIDEIPDCCRGAKVYDVVRWLPMVGPSKAKSIMRALANVAPVSESITLGHLSPKTRDELLRRIDRYCATADARRD